MNWKESTYLKERQYDSEKLCKLNNEEIDCWEKVVGVSALEDFFNENKLERSTILHSDAYIFDQKKFDKLMELEKLFFQNKWLHIKIPFLESREGRLVFDNFYLPFIKVGVYLLREKNQNTEIFEESFAEVLLERLSKAAMGILMFEMQLSKEEGKLFGKTPKEEYMFFNDTYLKSAKYIHELLDMYPVLGRIVFETIECLVENYTDFIVRLKKDRDELQAQFEINEWKIKKIEASGSDSHNKGKIVLIIILENGAKVVYKPRSLQTEYAYQKFCVEVSKRCKHQLKKLQIINKGEYGWEKFVRAESCNTEDELNRYYYRFGILIFINYILNANDLHVENIIAQGEYPVIIDAETILDNKKKFREKNARMVVSDYIHESVLYSGLLPFYRFTRKGKAVNMSAINGQEGVEYPILVPVIKDEGTSNMRYVYGHPVTQNNNNLARLGKYFIEPQNFLTYICEGFEDAYKVVLDDKVYMLEYIKIFRNLKVRHLIQDTQRYSMILHTSLHPYFMQNGKDRNLFLANMYKDYSYVQGDGDVVKTEIDDMLRMDIPYFYLDTSKTHLYGSNDKKIKDYFEETSMKHLEEKIENMDLQKLEEQKRFIKIALTDLDKCEKDVSIRAFPITNKSENVEIGDLWMAVRKIANMLLESAVWGEKKKDVNWLGISSIGQLGNPLWNIQPLGSYLYDGIAGIAIFFKALHCLSGDAKYSEICQALENNLFEYTDEIVESSNLSNETSGVFSGESGIIYTYMLLYCFTKKDKYLEYAEKHATIMEEIILKDSEYDIIYGNAGATLVMLRLYNITHVNKYLNVAYKAGKTLIKNQVKMGQDVGGWIRAGSKKALSGFSHGAAGIIYALTELWKITADKEILNSILMGLNFEKTLYRAEVKNWVDRREKTKEELEKYGCFMSAWCHGSAGILLGRSKIYNDIPPIYKEEIEGNVSAALCSSIQIGLSTNDCLCHGNLGNTEIFLEYAKVFGDDTIRNKYQKVRNEIAKEICKDSYNCGRKYLYGYKMPGFMTGISGMGYSLLRDLDKRLPCVLSIEL